MYHTHSIGQREYDPTYDEDTDTCVECRWLPQAEAEEDRCAAAVNAAEADTSISFRDYKSALKAYDEAATEVRRALYLLGK